MKVTKDPGLGSSFIKPVNRLLNEDGSYNIIRKGGLHGFKDFYKYLIDCSWFTFFGALIIGFFAINLLFACLYMIIGTEHLNGFNNDLSALENAFYFSAQTFTTVGYGAISPKGSITNMVAILESFTGLIGFAIATGLLWGRFSKPSLKIAFSRNIIITPFEGGQAVMFKMVNTRNNVLLNTKVKCIFIIDKESSEGAFNKQYYDMPLETNSVHFFPLTWTLVHKITSESPFAGLTTKDLKARHAEIVILVETFDETFSQTILQKHSYAGEQFMENVKFDRNFESNEKGEIVLHIRDLDKTSPVNV